jgi:2-methylcitrate dehydratase PrpD
VTATAAERLAAFVTRLAFADIPDDVATAAKLQLLDTLGCGLAAHALGVATEGRSVMAEVGGVAQASVIGLARRLPAAHAAFANAMLCHGLDFDSTHADSVCHVGTVIGPAAVAVAEARGAGGRALITAMVAGNEVVTRLGMAASGAFHARGFHPTSVCGIFGGVVATAYLEGLDAGTTTSALGIAGSMASGILAYLDDGSPTKPIHPAWAADGAITATRLAAHGGRGPRSVLEGRFGLLDAFLGQRGAELDRQLADLGERWETRRVAYKAYPACHFMHGVLTAASEAAGGHTFTADELAEVTVMVPPAAVPIVLEPAAAKQEPRTDYEGKFSLQYSTAALLVRGAVDVLTYSPKVMLDPVVLDVARRVRYETRDYPTYPGAFPGGVRIRLRDDRVLAADCAYQKGSPDNPLSPAEVREKFRRNAALALPDDAVRALEDAGLQLERERDLVSGLAAALGQASATRA